MNEPGTLEWIDLTVEDAEHVRDFYADIVGWTPEPVSMGEYDDYNMVTAGEPVAGVCHARGSNAALPPCGCRIFACPTWSRVLRDA